MKWVFGMVDTSITPALGYMEPVPDRIAATLLPIIQRHTLPKKTAIHSDEWADYSAYSRVQSLANFSRHESVNHSVEFVSASGVHTQNIESHWAQAKLKLKRMKGVAAEKLPSYLDEFMRRKRFAKNTSDAMENIVTHIADVYPVELASLLRSPTLKLHPTF